MPWPLQPQSISQAEPLKPGKQEQMSRSMQLPLLLCVGGETGCHGRCEG